MKKRIFTLIMAFALVFSTAADFGPVHAAAKSTTAKQKTDKNDKKITHHEAIPATCTQTGYVEYWTCDSPECEGKYFSDEECTKTLDTIVTPIDPYAHKYGEWKVVKEATETEHGLKERICPCGEKEQRETPMLQFATLEIPYTLNVTLLGNKKPEKETFEFAARFYCENPVEILEDSITIENLTYKDNKAVASGKMKLRIYVEDIWNYSEGFELKMVEGKSEGWNYAEEVWYVLPEVNETPTDPEVSGYKYILRSNDPADVDAEPQESMYFNVSYEKNETNVTPPNNDKPGNDVPNNDKPGTEVPNNDKPGTDVTNNDKPGTVTSNNDNPVVKPVATTQVQTVSAVPKTGDNSNVAIPMAVLGLSLLAVAKVLVGKHKRV